MRFQVMITVELDVESYRDVLENRSSLGNIRDDVRWRAALDLRDSLRADGINAAVSVDQEQRTSPARVR